MTPDKIREIVATYEDRFSGCEPQRDMAQPKAYVRWMCRQIVAMLDEADTQNEFSYDSTLMLANRWLGFIEGILWSTGEFTIDQLREYDLMAQPLAV